MINILGLFHVGCCCQRNITCGFETSHNFARLALCRDLNMRRCEGFVFDFGCNLQNYLLNREPREFGFKRVLVDSFHFQNHNSCSSSYDASKYNKTKLFIIIIFQIQQIIKSTNKSAIDTISLLKHIQYFVSI